MSTTSGRSRSASVHGLLAVGHHRDHLDVRRRGEELLQPTAHDRVIVGDEDPDHGSGTRTRNVVPSPGVEPTSSEPPASASRPRSALRPTCPASTRVARRWSSKPRPSSTTSRSAVRSSRRQGDLRRRRLRMVDDVAQPLLGAPVEQPGGSVGYPVEILGHREGGRDATFPGPLGEVAEGRLQALLPQVRRVEVDDQRAQRRGRSPGPFPPTAPAAAGRWGAPRWSGPTPRGHRPRRPGPARRRRGGRSRSGGVRPRKRRARVAGAPPARAGGAGAGGPTSRRAGSARARASRGRRG